MSKEKFWLVWDGLRAPIFRHDSKFHATTEAERLSNTHPGISFYVLEALSVSQKNVVVTTKLEEISDPFAEP